MTLNVTFITCKSLSHQVNMVNCLCVCPTTGPQILSKQNVSHPGRNWPIALWNELAADESSCVMLYPFVLVSSMFWIDFSWFPHGRSLFSDLLLCLTRAKSGLWTLSWAFGARWWSSGDCGNSSASENSRRWQGRERERSLFPIGC